LNQRCVPPSGGKIGSGQMSKIIRTLAHRKCRILHLASKNGYSTLTESVLIARLKEQDRQAQKMLYDRYAGLLFSVCRRYLWSREDAEEAVETGFFKIFTQIDAYQGMGSFEGWMRRIMVNEALMCLRKRQSLVFPGAEWEPPEQEDGFNIEADISAREIMALIEELPPGYRTVFNLYVLEGFKHHEIADTLGISINTSKSQLILAKERMRQLLKRYE
jgi:RNA polymerase sigma factor (sigma-70 family)